MSYSASSIHHDINTTLGLNPHPPPPAAPITPPTPWNNIKFLQSLADTTRDSEVLTSAAARVACILAETTLGEAGPELACVVASRQCLVGVEDGVTG